MNVTTYKSLLTGKRTMVVASMGKCGYKGYREAKIMLVNGALTYVVTDGYTDLFELKCPKTTTLKMLLRVLPSLLNASNDVGV
jgi:hypothetical protein